MGSYSKSQPVEYLTTCRLKVNQLQISARLKVIWLVVQLGEKNHEVEGSAGLKHQAESSVRSSIDFS